MAEDKEKGNVFIFQGTEGYPEENWFPWLKEKLERKGPRVFVPQFPSPPGEPASVDAWFAVLQSLDQYLNVNTILIGHSLGGIFALRVLERLMSPVKAAFFVGTPIGVKPIKNYDRDSNFSGFNFHWQMIRSKAQYFTVYHSDNDPYVSFDNGKQLAEALGVKLTFIPNAGHFNTRAGYTKFEDLFEKIVKIIS